MRTTDTMARLTGLFMLALAWPAQAAVLDASEHGFTIENVIELKTSPPEAYTALIRDVGQWWPAEHSWFGKAGNFSIDARAGGCFCEIDGERQVMHMQIAQAMPGQLLRMMGGLGPLQGMGLSGPLDWRFAPHEGGTRITLHYRVAGYAPGVDVPAFAAVVDRVQALQLGALGDFLRKQ